MTKASDILLEAPEEQHIIGDFVKTGEKGEIKGYCAVGYLRCQGGYYKDGLGLDEAYKKVGFYHRYDRAVHPTEGKPMSILEIVIDLNDAHKWTFKQIGQWLKELGY